MAYSRRQISRFGYLSRLYIAAPAVLFIGQAFVCLFLSGCVGAASDARRSSVKEFDALWIREELYFGSDIPTGGTVTDSLWEDFVDREVVARFPDGFTTVPALGRYRYRTGEIKKEPTRIIILYYPPSEKEASRWIEDIIEAYKKKFFQESVLRVRGRTETRYR